MFRVQGLPLPSLEFSKLPAAATSAKISRWSPAGSPKDQDAPASPSNG